MIENENRPKDTAALGGQAPVVGPAERSPGITAIITRLEEAAEGSRELDGLIFRATHECADPDHWWDFSEGVWCHRDHEDTIAFDTPPSFTTSLDAALPWENITFVMYYSTSVPPHWTAYHSHPDESETAGSHPTSEAIARRLAALKARLAEGCQSGAASPEIGSVPNTAAETEPE
jgi:hypothetical protein